MIAGYFLYQTEKLRLHQGLINARRAVMQDQFQLLNDSQCFKIIWNGIGQQDHVKPI